MTVEEMRKKIQNHCDFGLFDCKQCILLDFCKNSSNDWEEEADETIIKVYKCLIAEKVKRG